MTAPVKAEQFPDDTVVLSCPGRLNLASAPRLTKAIEQTVDAGRARIVIDLAETTFIDSSGLGALVAGLKRARSAGGDLRVARASDQAVAVLCLTNLDRILRPYLSITAALADWRA